MTIPNKRCDFCHRWYEPDPRVGEDQVACQREACRKKRKARADRNWRIKHPGYGVKWKYKLREWAASYPDNWRHYRLTHPEYAERERKRMRSKRERLKIVAKQDARVQMAVEKLESIQAQTPKTVAKQDAIHRRVDGIVDYLFWKEGVAKPNATDLALSP